jgi:hypothetical protein
MVNIMNRRLPREQERLDSILSSMLLFRNNSGDASPGRGFSATPANILGDITGKKPLQPTSACRLR